jgi:hypothetical protein
MVKKLVLLTIACCFSFAAFAADSASNRGNSMLAIEYQGGGISVASFIAAPLRVGYMLSEELEVGLEYGGKTYSWDSISTSVTNMGLYGRYYLGNSFNIYASLLQRSANAGYSILGTTIDATLSSMALTAAIGNKWQWDFGLTLGIDWLAYSMPLSLSESSAIALTTAQAEDLAQTNTDYNALYTLALFSISLGFSF